MNNNTQKSELPNVQLKLNLEFSKINPVQNCIQDNDETELETKQTDWHAEKANKTKNISENHKQKIYKWLVNILKEPLRTTFF